MESNPQSDNTEQPPLKHNWSKFKPPSKELNDGFNPDMPVDNAEFSKSKVFSGEEKARTIPSKQVRNILVNDVKITYTNYLLTKYWDIEVKKAYNYIVEHPKMRHNNQFELFKAAAEYGHPAGQYHLANCYFLGDGCEKSEEKGLEWYAKARENGYNENSTWTREDQNKSEELCSIF